MACLGVDKELSTETNCISPAVEKKLLHNRNKGYAKNAVNRIV